MKETLSPFAALTTKERLEKWNLWQSQHQEEIAIKSEPTIGDSWSESVSQGAKPTVGRDSIKPHHSQYDAVVKRMRMASRGARSFQPCTTVDNTRQDSFGRL